VMFGRATTGRLQAGLGGAVTKGYHVYELKVGGVASDLLRAEFEDVDLRVVPGRTCRRTGLVDQAALFGLIRRIEDLSLVLLEVAAAAEYRCVCPRLLGSAVSRNLAGDEGLLTTRESEVLRLLASRLTAQEIAQTLFVSPNTLKSHMKSIYHKLGINTRAEAVREGHARALV
jgi:DNA-binding CsgD family transcriptional regulator